MNSRGWECLLVLGVLLTVGLSLSGIVRQKTDRALEDVRELSAGWYRLEDGRRFAVQVPGTVVLEGGGDLVLYNDSLTDADQGATLTTRGAVYRLQIALGDEVLYAYDDTAFPRNKQMRAKLDCNAVLPEETSAQPLVLSYEDPGDGRFVLAEVYLGSSSAVFRRHCAGDAFTLLIVFTMALMSVAATVIALYLAKVHMQDRRFGDVACFLLLCGAWCALDSSLVQELSGQSPLVCYLSFYAFMTLGIPMLHFVRNTGEMKRFRSLNGCIGAFWGC